MDKHGHAAELLAEKKGEEMKKTLPRVSAKEQDIAAKAKRRGTRNREMWS